MSIEDISYLKNNSIKQTYTFLIDSKERDRNIYPNPNNYTIQFSSPFKNIIGMEVVDASIPRTMYNIDYENNTIYYYIGTDDNDTFIKNGVTDTINCDLVILNSNYDYNQDELNDIVFVNNSLELIDKSYAYIKNYVNIYNIYNIGGIGGNNIGITFCFTIKANASYKSGNGEDNTYTIIDFRYNHLINPSVEKFSPIVVKIIRQQFGTNSFNIVFMIGNETNMKIINNINLNDYVHIAWTISENNLWNIYLNSITDNSYIYNSLFSIKNVFYTDKYIGKRYEFNYGDWDTARLNIKDFKIYNYTLNEQDVINCMNNTNTSQQPVIWYKMNEKNNYSVNNDIDYKDVFNKIEIEPGDYTLKSFFNNYENLNDLEISFKKHSDPTELTNLLDVYSKKPFILDMNRSTLSENLGFDLYNTDIKNERYIYIDSYVNNNIMSKMFHSILNDDKVVQNNNDSFDDIYKVTSPGIVYFIGNKYIIMRCPEIEEHLYRSLSYSKNTLGLAKFRVDNVGLNNERLTITKLPVREFHPIGKLSKITLKFETNTGSLYDFKGVNHNIIFAIYYYEPTQMKTVEKSTLNPQYKMNYIEYKYMIENVEGDSDDEEEDYSRDDINEYKKKEAMYSTEGVKLQQYNKYFVNNNTDNNEKYELNNSSSDSE